MAGADRLGGRKTLKVSGFLEEFEKDAVKRRVDIVELFGSFGVELTRKGKSYTGLCPWHGDKTPSLSVDRDKGLYHCFGCGESGDAVSLVEKMKAVGFREALEFLRSWPGRPAASRSSSPTSSPAAPAAARPEAAAAEGSHPGLDAVAEHYHKRLAGHGEALAYLRKRGLDSPELLRRFGLGVADGSLPSRLSNGQKGALQELGVLSSSGREHLYGCLTVPLHDERGRVVGLYGRAIEERRRVKHLYLKGPHRGVFHRQAARVYEELILTESILDALSLITVGVQNVQALYGAGGLTAEHLEALKADRVKTIVLALDADEAGRKASESLAERLLAEGFAVKRIEPPSGKDWNEALSSGLDKEQVQDLVEQAKRLSPAETAGGAMDVTQEGAGYRFRFGSLSYRVLGSREVFVSSLRVNIKAQREGEVFYDNLDLYSARSRNAYSHNLAALFGLEPRGVEKQLVRILEYLEQMRDSRRSSVGQQPAKVELTEQQRAVGLEFLRSPDLFDQVVQDMERLGYVGEELNKMLLYLAASSRKMADPISILILSQSAAGKSLLVDTVKRLMPAEQVLCLTSLSDQALNYIPEGALKHTFLILGEAVHSEVVEHQIREMLSAHELSRLVTVKDEKTGQMRSRQVRSEVVVAAVMSTTGQQINPENASRCFLINSDESVQQTQAIHRSQRDKYSLSRYHERRHVVPRIIEKHVAAQRLLRPLLIVNPFGQWLDFPSSLIRTRRDHERFVDLIACVCFLRQYQKQPKGHRDPDSGEQVEYVLCDQTDYEIAHRILIGSVLSSTFAEIPKSLVRFYERVRELFRQAGEEHGLRPLEVSLTRRDIRTRIGWLGAESVKKYLKRLVDYEYLQLLRGGSRGMRNAYRLVADEPMERVDTSMIPTPEQIREKMKSG